MCLLAVAHWKLEALAQREAADAAQARSEVLVEALFARRRGTLPDRTRGYEEGAATTRATRNDDDDDHWWRITIDDRSDEGYSDRGGSSRIATAEQQSEEHGQERGGVQGKEP